MAKPEDKTILVVDDEPDTVLFLQTLLEDAGFRVVTARDGDEALEKVKAGKPDFISLDLVMPRKSGIRFFYELRKNKEWSKIPVVIVTGQARDEAVKRDLDDMFSGRVVSGPRTYLEKPVKAEHYVNMIKQELGIEITKTGEAAAGDEAELRDELRAMAGMADLDALKEALRILKDKKN
jgi:two-component system alkaline phosphatase synthesis response regulator PhoP